MAECLLTQAYLEQTLAKSPQDYEVWAFRIPSQYFESGTLMSFPAYAYTTKITDKHPTSAIVFYMKTVGGYPYACSAGIAISSAMLSDANNCYLGPPVSHGLAYNNHVFTPYALNAHPNTTIYDFMNPVVYIIY